MTQHLDMTRAIIEQMRSRWSPISTPATATRSMSCTSSAPMRGPGSAAVVIEDKTFPKDTSLLAGGRQELVRVEEFQGKIEAARAAGREHGLLVIARTEALIADLGLDEALRRGAAYAEAGADLLLVHSKQKTPDEIVAFTGRWPGTIPLVLVPTAYPDLTEAKVARARQDRHRHLRQPCGARRGHRDARGVRRDPPRRRHPQCRQAHRLGRGHLRPAARRRDEGGREEISTVSGRRCVFRTGSDE